MTLDELKTYLTHQWALYDHELMQTIETLEASGRHKRRVRYLEGHRRKTGQAVGATIFMLNEIEKIKK